MLVRNVALRIQDLILLRIQDLILLRIMHSYSRPCMLRRSVAVDRLARFGKTALLVLGLALLLMGTANCGSDARESAVKWLYDREEAFVKAEHEDKPLMINFYSDMCPACDYLDSRTFSDEELGAFVNNNLIPLKSNVGVSSLHSRYGIPSVPTVVLASSEGTEMGRIVGYKAHDKFYREMQAVLARW